MAAVPWLMALHITALLLWCAALFALPGLLAACRAGQDDEHRLRGMTRFTYLMLASPAAVIAVISGTLLIYPTEAYSGWLALKLTAVAGLVLFHVLCGRLIVALLEQPQLWSVRIFHALVGLPAVLVVVILWLVLAKPL